MIVGTVRWFDVSKGYGFLRPDDGGIDLLVDICALERAGMASLIQGQRLSFEVVHDERVGRSRAENLSTPLDCSPATEPHTDMALPGEPAVDGRRVVGLT